MVVENHLKGLSRPRGLLASGLSRQRRHALRLADMILHDDFDRRHHFPLRPSGTWFGPCVRFTLSYRDVKDLLAERGWTSRMRPFGDGSSPLFARELARGGLS